MFHYRLMLFILLMLGSTLYALMRGGAPERIAAVLLAIAYALSVVASAHPHYAEHFERTLFLIDLGLFASLYMLSIVTARFWPIWMCAMQGVAVLGHVVDLLAPWEAYGYAIMMQFWAYPIQILLIVATRRHRRRLSLRGRDPAWAWTG